MFSRLTNDAILLAFCMGACLVGFAPSELSCAQDSGLGQAPGDGPVGQRILSVLRDARKTDAQKALELSAVRGSLTPQDSSTLSELLKKQEGALFVALGDTMLRCGAGAEATSVAEAIVLNRRSPLAQWTAALCVIGRSAWHPVRGTRKALTASMDELVARLKHPASEQQLLAILRAREFIWQPNGWWLYQGPVILELCELLKHKNPEVREAAALALAGTRLEWYITSDAVIALANLAAESKGEVQTAVSGILQRVLGIGPDTNDPPTTQAFWKNWVRVNADGFNLTWYALKRAAPSQELALSTRQFLGRQVMFSSRQLPEEELPKVWAALRKIFDEDKSGDSERCSAWLYPLVMIAARDETGTLDSQAVSMLLAMSKSNSPVLREWALGQIGNLPNATKKGSSTRQALEAALRDAKRSPGERASAAWSLRRALKGNPNLIEELVALAEGFQGLPDGAFSRISRSRCIGLVCGALAEATGKYLSLDPSEWRKALADFLPPRK